ncbi:hypothetical protein [Pelagibacterium luteolum]|uniref:Uncharacterized protein n=1 Tax=Pelagibacterium luteolum TaxID=440168 RepID=A0A1G7XHT0_9HYPH|nr:hypothetical protein [Pelagibacterium luteolum]SDG83778.1 hypothetical protein SAMN04487974_109127 [Pelagibacterium luteolum]
MSELETNWRVEAIKLGPVNGLVQLEGCYIDGLKMAEHGDVVTLTVDDRFAIDVKPEDVPQVAWLVAQALAVGAGHKNLRQAFGEHSFSRYADKPDEEALN